MYGLIYKNVVIANGSALIDKIINHAVIYPNQHTPSILLVIVHPSPTTLEGGVDDEKIHEYW
jgi:hypothetical protein